MCLRLLMISLLSLFIPHSLYADSDPGLIQLQLRQKPDMDCDGIPEKSIHSIPGACVIYEIEALNTGETDYENVQVSTKIPEHTILMRTYYRLHSDEPVDSIIVQSQGNIRLLKTRLDLLKPGQANKVILHYSVKIL